MDRIPDWLDYFMIGGSFFLLGLAAVGMLLGLWRMRKPTNQLVGASGLIGACFGGWRALNILMTSLNMRPPLIFFAAWCGFGLLLAVAMMWVTVLYAREWSANQRTATMAAGESLRRT